MGRRQQLIQRGYALLQALPVRAPRRPRIRLITAYDDAIADYGDIAAKNHADYAARHGYAHHVYRSGFDPSRPPAWSKILFTLRAMRGADWVVWIDADILIMDQARRLESFITPGHDFILGQHQLPNPHANTGFFFVRRRLWTRALLRHTYSLTSVIHHPMWEQIAFNILIDQYRLPRLSKVPARNFNSLYSGACAEDVYQSGDFLVHFAGQPGKVALMQSFLGQQVR